MSTSNECTPHIQKFAHMGCHRFAKWVGHEGKLTHVSLTLIIDDSKSLFACGIALNTIRHCQSDYLAEINGKWETVCTSKGLLHRIQETNNLINARTDTFVTPKLSNLPSENGEVIRWVWRGTKALLTNYTLRGFTLRWGCELGIGICERWTHPSWQAF